MTTYRWTPGSHIKANAQVIGERLDTLQRSLGERLSPRAVVDDARAADSPLHPCFEWNDAAAADYWREGQARHLILCIRVVTKENEAEQLHRVFVNVEETVDDETARSYVPMARVLASDDLRHQLIVKARRDLIAFKSRYAEFAALAKVADRALDEVDEIERELVEAPA